MLRHEPLTSTLRFYESETDDPFARYVAVCTLIWETPKTVWIRGMHGEISRKQLRELAVYLLGQGVETIKAHRAPGRTIWFGRIVGDHMEVDLKSFERRYPQDIQKADQ